MRRDACSSRGWSLHAGGCLEETYAEKGTSSCSRACISLYSSQVPTHLRYTLVSEYKTITLIRVRSREQQGEVPRVLTVLGDILSTIDPLHLLDPTYNMTLVSIKVISRKYFVPVEEVLVRVFLLPSPVVILGGH